MGCLVTDVTLCWLASVTMVVASCPLASLRGKCDTELIWPPEADAEAELRPGPGAGPRLHSLVWSRPEPASVRPGPASGGGVEPRLQPLTTQTTDLERVEAGVPMLSAQIIPIYTMLMAANKLTATNKYYLDHQRLLTKPRPCHKWTC